jgi:hypothetical protein
MPFRRAKLTACRKVPRIYRRESLKSSQKGPGNRGFRGTRAFSDCWTVAHLGRCGIGATTCGNPAKSPSQLLALDADGRVTTVSYGHCRLNLCDGGIVVDYDAAATTIINRNISGGAPVPCGVDVQFPGVALAIPQGGNGNACSPNFSWWQVGSRTQWNPDLDIGVDVLWTHLNTAYKGPGVGLVPSGAPLGGNGARPAGLYTLDDQDVLSVMFRIQRNFLP